MDTLLNGLLRGLSLIYNLDPDLVQIVLLSLGVSGGALAIATLTGGILGIAIGLKEFRGKRLIVNMLNTFMGLPPVVVGLVVYIFLSRSGPLGFLGLLYSPVAMVCAQTILAFPIITALSISAVSGISPAVKETALSLGASPRQLLWVTLYEARFAIMAAVIAGFGRIIAEVGAVMMVGGNIAGRTRVMTTAIVLETSKGAFELAIALGFILIGLSFGINLVLNCLQGE